MIHGIILFFFRFMLCRWPLYPLSHQPSTISFSVRCSIHTALLSRFTHKMKLILLQAASWAHYYIIRWGIPKIFWKTTACNCFGVYPKYQECLPWDPSGSKNLFIVLCYVIWLYGFWNGGISQVCAWHLCYIA